MSEGLAGVVAGRTSICTVGKEGASLTYRGYDNGIAGMAAWPSSQSTT